MAKGPKKARGFAALFTLAVLAVTLTCLHTSLQWIGTTFPGFFVMANRVIPSAALPHWTGPAHGGIYQAAVVAVNGQPVTSSAEIYALVRRLPARSPISYTLERNGERQQVTIPSMTFTPRDYLSLFGAYLFNGLLFALIGIAVWWVRPATPDSFAILLCGFVSGLFGLTAADLYGPHRFFPLHAAVEALFPATFIHLALVFPSGRLTGNRRLLLLLPYLFSGALTVVYELFLYQPPLYSLSHNLASAYAGVAALFFFGAVLHSFLTSVSPPVHQRTRALLVGTLFGLFLPAGVMSLSGLSGGAVAVNWAALTAFVFPLSLGFVAVRYGPIGAEETA